MKVLVLHASALHLGFLGCYGNTWIATPNVDRLAAEGVVFERHFADNLGYCTCCTGRFQWPMAADSGLANAQKLLQTHVGDSVVINGLDIPASADATPLESTLDAVVGAIQGLADKPHWLCWVDLPSLYPPWDVADEFTSPYLGEENDEEDEDGNEPFHPLRDPPIGQFDRDDLVSWERIRCTYSGAVTYLDAGLGLLFEELKKDHLFDDLTVIFTSHRGVALGEHGIIGDCLPWLHEEVVHLPLIVRQSGGADPGQRIFALTQPVDLFATLLDLFGTTAPPMDGRSWLPLLRGQQDVLRQHGISTWKLGEAEEWALRTLQHALLVPVAQPAELQPRPVQLYLKPEDRWEVNNVIQHHLDLAEGLERTLRTCCCPSSVKLSSLAPPPQSS
jgi:arylsulfatase A-like enzyme